MNIKPTFIQDSQPSPGVRFTMRVLNQIARAERDAELVEACASIAELAAQMQQLPHLNEPIRGESENGFRTDAVEGARVSRNRVAPLPPMLRYSRRCLPQVLLC